MNNKRQYKEYDEKTLKKVQGLELEILKDFMDICERHFEFSDFEECRSFFKKMINIIRQMNYTAFKSDKFNDYQQQLNKFIA